MYRSSLIDCPHAAPDSVWINRCDALAAQVAERHGAVTFIDEVHGVGLYGDLGGGVAQQNGLEHRLDIVSGLSIALLSCTHLGHLSAFHRF